MEFIASRHVAMTSTPLGLDEWNARYARPADDIRALRDDIDAGLVDFAELEMA